MPTLVDAYSRATPRKWMPDLGPLRRNMPNWDRPERTMVFVLLIVAVTILGAIAMLPNTEEKAQVLLSQGRTAEAIALYEGKRAETRLNPFETFSLASLYRDGGQTDALVQVLEEEISTRPQSDWARADLVAIYRGQARLGDEARVLVQSFIRNPALADKKRLLGLYRLLNDRAGEQALLETARAAGLTTAADLARLSLLKSNAITDGAVFWRAAPRAGDPNP